MPAVATFGDASKSTNADVCPLCVEPMCQDDKNLFPCECGYQICLWCLNHLRVTNAPCPACRRPYADPGDDDDKDGDENEGDGDDDDDDEEEDSVFFVWLVVLFLFFKTRVTAVPGC
eukprot:GHVU01060767.1.p1 GENE.GHVU01060767.1~~GHVU01060767.1.p1  ORF type:complete len:117 (+),score=11.30 GHVU01060767.1:236-586(+)